MGKIQEPLRQTKPKKGRFMNFSRGQISTKIRCELRLFSQSLVGKNLVYTKVLSALRTQAPQQAKKRFGVYQKACFQGKRRQNVYTPKSLRGVCEGPLRAVLVYRFWPPIFSLVFFLLRISLVFLSFSAYFQGGPGSVSVTVWGWKGSIGFGFRFRRFLYKKRFFSVFQYSLTGKDGSGFGSWKTVPAVPVPLSVSGKTVPTVPVFRFRFGSRATL